MITDEEIKEESKSAIDRNSFILGANWAINKIRAESERPLSVIDQANRGIEMALLKVENDKLRALLRSIINVSDAEKAIPFAGLRNYEDEVYAAIKAAKKDLK